MYLPRGQISQLYEELINKYTAVSAPVLIFTSLNVDSLCATRILSSLLRREYVRHTVQPVSGYSDLQEHGQKLVHPMTRQQGGDGGTVVCLGVGGLVDLEEVLGLDGQNAEGEDVDMRNHGVEVWVVDARRPWNLQNVFGNSVQAAQENAAPEQRHGTEQGRILSNYRSGKGGVIVWDDGDIQSDLSAEREAFMALQDMPDIDEEDLALEHEDDDTRDAPDEDEPSSSQSRKRKASQSEDNSDSEDEGRPKQRRRSNPGTPLPSSPGGNIISGQLSASSQPSSPNAVIPSSPPKPPSPRQLRKKLLNLRRKHQATLEAYYNLGTSHSEPISSMLYSLASELGAENNDFLWLAIVGISAADLSPYSSPPKTSNSRAIQDRSEQVREVLRDEVRRLNPIPEAELQRSQHLADTIPTKGRGPADTSIRLSPEPRFLLIRHWSLYDSMFHSPYLSTRLHIWSEPGRKRLHKLLAKMGVSLEQAGKGYVHMDMELKRSLRDRILKFAPQYNLDGLVPGVDGHSGKEGWGFVRSWGWKATLSATDVATIASAILEVGTEAPTGFQTEYKYDPLNRLPQRHQTHNPNTTYNNRVQRSLPSPPHSDEDDPANPNKPSEPDFTTHRFFAAYDALNPVSTSNTQGLAVLLHHIPTAQHLHRAILRTGSSLISKKLIRHLRAFRMGVVKEGPDTQLFCHPGALVKLASWTRDALAVLEAEKGRKVSANEALVLACLDEGRGVYVVVGLGSGGVGKRVKTKAELREREAKKKRKEAEKVAKKAQRARKREERKRLQRERDEANGLFVAEDEEDDDSDATESTVSSRSGDGDSSDDEDGNAAAGSQGLKARRGAGLNRFGQAFQAVVEETAARVRIDSFEHSVVEVRKEDLSGFLEALSGKSVVG
ncbi:hypothetical protein MBLNU230_g7781t1 [Neophaeotheca triangularis]